MTPRIGSLCSGAGGLDLAVEHVTGGRTIWHAEYDDDAAKVLETRWPGTPNHRDITSIDWSRVEPADIVCAGYPCQPFSAAGERKGTDDERHLWPYVAEAIRVLRPRLVILENVAGHRSLGFDCVLADLAEMRYDAQWCSIRASDVGAPHRRERIFIVAYPEGDRWDQGWSESARLVGRPDAAICGMPTAADTEGDGRQGKFDGAIGTAARGARVRQPSGSTWGTSGPVDLLPTPSAADGNGGRQRSREALDSGDHQVNLTDLPRLLLPTPTSRDHKGAANPPGRLRDGRARTTGDDMLPDAVMALLPTPRTTDAKGSGAHGAGGPDLRTVVTTGIEWGKYEPVIRRWEAITREAPSPTELGTKGNPRLAAPFSEWMQGWPLGWVTDIAISRSAMLRIIGNGVVPQQAIAALYWLLSVSEVAA